MFNPPGLLHKTSGAKDELWVKSSVPAWLWVRWFCWNDPPEWERWNLSCTRLPPRPATHTPHVNSNYWFTVRTTSTLTYFCVRRSVPSGQCYTMFIQMNDATSHRPQRLLHFGWTLHCLVTFCASAVASPVFLSWTYEVGIIKTNKWIIKEIKKLQLVRSDPSWILTHHEEGSSVIILLEKLVFSFRRFVSDEFAAVAQLGSALLLCQVVESLDFSLLLLHAEDKHTHQHSVTTETLSSSTCSCKTSVCTHTSRASLSLLMRFSSRTFQASYSSSSFSPSVSRASRAASVRRFSSNSFLASSSTILSV